MKSFIIKMVIEAILVGVTYGFIQEAVEEADMQETMIQKEKNKVERKKVGVSIRLG